MSFHIFDGNVRVWNPNTLSFDYLQQPGGTAGGSGTEYVEDAVSPANPAAPALMVRHRDAPSGEGTVDGDWIAVNGTYQGAMYVAPNATWPVTGLVSANCNDSGGNGLISVTGDPAATERGLVVRNIPSGTQPVSGSVAVTNIGTFPVQVTSAPTTAVTGQFWQATQPVSGTVTANAGTNLNTSALALDATLTGGTARVKITDGTNNAAVKAASTAAVAADPAQVVAFSPNTPLPTGSNVIGALTANQSTNTAQVAGATLVTAATGVQKVGVVGNAGAIFDGVTGAAVPANALLNGARAATANPANATGGNMVALLADKAGRVVTTTAHVRDLVAHQQTAVAVNTETTIVTAGAAGVFNDLVQLIITTAGAAAQTITIKDATAGTTRLILNYPNAALAPGAPMILNFDPPIPQAVAASAWTVTQSLATSCNYTARYIKNT